MINKIIHPLLSFLFLTGLLSSTSCENENNIFYSTCDENYIISEADKTNENPTWLVSQLCSGNTYCPYYPAVIESDVYVFSIIQKKVNNELFYTVLEILRPVSADNVNVNERKGMIYKKIFSCNGDDLSMQIIKEIPSESTDQEISILINNILDINSCTDITSAEYASTLSEDYWLFQNADNVYMKTNDLSIRKSLKPSSILSKVYQNELFYIITYERVSTIVAHYSIGDTFKDSYKLIYDCSGNVVAELQQANFPLVHNVSRQDLWVDDSFRESFSTWSLILD